MYVENLPNGQYKYVERYKDPMTLKYRRVSITLDKNDRKTTKLAESILADKISSALAISDNSYLTFSDLIDKYLTHQKKSVREGTYKRDLCQCNIIKDIIGSDVLLSRLSARYVRECLDKTGKKNVTKNTYLKRYKAVVRWGFQNDYVDDISYLEKLTPYEDRRQREKIEDKYLEKNEMQLLLSDMEKSTSPQWFYLTKFLILSGLRIGEAIVLEKKDIDDEYIHITKTYSLTTETVGPPKTPESIRDIFIQDELAALLKEIRSYNRKNKISSKLLFSEDGHYIDYDNYRMYLRRHAKKSIGRVITPHALRHTHASLLLANGMSIDSISRRLGHRDSTVTKDIYLHIMEELKQRDNETIKSLNII